MATNPVDLAISRLSTDPAIEGAAADIRLLAAELRGAGEAIAWLLSGAGAGCEFCPEPATEVVHAPGRFRAVCARCAVEPCKASVPLEGTAAAALPALPELWTCPACAFTFDACHQDDKPEGGYSCPACAELELQAEAATLRAALEYLTSCDHGKGLDCPDCEPVPDLARKALEGAAGRALAAELAAARAVVEAARVVGDEDLDETDVAEQLASAIDAYDAAVKEGARQ
jgi:hypothetical protein